MWKIRFFLSWFKWLSMEDQLYIRKISLCSSLLSFLIFFQDIGCPPPSTWRQACFEKKQRIFCATKVTRSDHHWQVAQPSDFVIPREGWLSVNSLVGAAVPKRSSYHDERQHFYKSGILLQDFFNKKIQSKWGQVRRVATLLRRKSIRWHSHTPDKNSVIMKNLQKKGETGSVCSMYGIFNPTAYHRK